MNAHRNARLTFARRLEMVRNVLENGDTLRSAAITQGVSVSTVRKWLARYRSLGANGLYDTSSRPRTVPLATPEPNRLRMVELRRLALSMRDIARHVGCSVSTVSRVCAKAGLTAPSRKK